MLRPELPQPWLANTMRSRFSGLCSWTEALGASVFGPETTLADAFPAKLGGSVEDVREKRLRGRGLLPWRAPDNGGATGVGSTFLANAADSIPVVGQLRRNTRMRQSGGKTPDEEQTSSWQALTAIGSLVAGVGIAVGYALHSGLISFPLGGETRDERRNGLAAFGEAGEALGLYAQRMQAPPRSEATFHDNITAEGVPIVEVDAEAR
jgi:sorting and assembly machinery component 37